MVIMAFANDLARSNTLKGLALTVLAAGNMVFHQPVVAQILHPSDPHSSHHNGQPPKNDKPDPGHEREEKEHNTRRLTRHHRRGLTIR